jgi:hypothetical protein
VLIILHQCSIAGHVGKKYCGELSHDVNVRNSRLLLGRNFIS